MPIPQNAQAIYQFLTGHGYSANAAAGIVGNIEQESGGNPAEPGGGLIQILGHVGGTLAQELQAILAYNNGPGQATGGSIATLNAQPTPQAAALYYSQKFERPNAGLANNTNRMNSAAEVAAAAKSGNWTSTTTGSAGGTQAQTAGLLSWPADITGFFGDAKSFIDALLWLVNPASWLRIGSFFMAIILLGVALYIFVRADSDQPLFHMPSVMPVPV